MLFYDRQINDARIAVWHVTEDYEQLLSMLPDGESVRAEAESRFRSQSRLIEWVAVRVLLYNMLNRQVAIEYLESGAPLLPDDEALSISISHTHGYVAILLSEDAKAGIDVEVVERKDNGALSRIEKVRQRFMREDEYADSIVGMLLHWSAKETAYKYMQRPDVDFLRDLRVEPFDEMEMEGNLTLTDLHEDISHLLYYKVFEDFVLTYEI